MTKKPKVRRVRFYCHKGPGNSSEETIEFPVETTDDEVKEAFFSWLEQETYAQWDDLDHKEEADE